MPSHRFILSRHGQGEPPVAAHPQIVAFAYQMQHSEAVPARTWLRAWVFCLRPQTSLPWVDATLSRFSYISWFRGPLSDGRADLVPVLPLVRPLLLRWIVTTWRATGVPLASPPPQLSFGADASSSGGGAPRLPDFTDATDLWHRIFRRTQQLARVEGGVDGALSLGSSAQKQGTPRPL